MSKNLITIQAEQDKVEITYSTMRMTFNSFLTGIAWGVGSVLGATVIVALLIFLAGKLDTVPIIGEYISDIIEYIQSTTTQ